MRLGKITENALKRSVLKQIKTEFKGKISAAVGTDCAFSDSKKVYSASSPVTVDIRDCGYYAVMKAANSLISQGIIPDHVNVSILLAQDLEEPVIKEIVRDCIAACKKVGTVYAGGHTEVTSAVNRPVVTATCVGYRGNNKGSSLDEAKALKPGQDIVITKWVALEGTAMLADARREELLSRYPATFIDNGAAFKDYLDINEEVEVILEHEAAAIHDISNGGVFAGLWEISQKAGMGLTVDLKKIPIRQETVEICEFFELNPYELLSGGSLIVVTDDGEGLVSELEKKGIPAAVVGNLAEGKDKVITNADESRFLDLPQADEIHKVLG